MELGKKNDLLCLVYCKMYLYLSNKEIFLLCIMGLYKLYLFLIVRSLKLVDVNLSYFLPIINQKVNLLVHKINNVIRSKDYRFTIWLTAKSFKDRKTGNTF